MRKQEGEIKEWANILLIEWGLVSRRAKLYDAMELIETLDNVTEIVSGAAIDIAPTRAIRPTLLKIRIRGYGAKVMADIGWTTTLHIMG